MEMKIPGKRILVPFATCLLFVAAYTAGNRNATVAHANAQADNATQKYSAIEGSVPKSYGKLVAAIPDQIGTGLVFEGTDGVIRFVSVNGMKEGELARYDKTPTQGGIPKSYGHLVSAVVNPDGTALIFEDAQGTIRFVTITGKKEAELVRN
jgi:hypothetical protein